MENSLGLILEYHDEPRVPVKIDLRATYQSLRPQDIESLILTALKSKHQSQILLCLACFRPGSLRQFHELLLERGIFHPGIIFHDASEETSRRLLSELDGSIGRRLWSVIAGGHPETLHLDHVLIALAWAGNEAAQRTFAQWQTEPPPWTGKLHVGAHEYALAAGWELDPQGRRRDLFYKNAIPLVKADDATASDAQVEIWTPVDDTCEWCHQQLSVMMDLDLTNHALAELGLGGSRMRLITCAGCTCYGHTFFEVDLEGHAHMRAGSPRPRYLPQSPLSALQFSSTSARLSSHPRHFLESASWSLPVTFSQIGGCPTWVQDAEYPPCPSCSETMPFIAQLSVEDFERYGEGFYYAFYCRRCGIAATGYQQS